MEQTNDARGRFVQQVKSVRDYSRIAGVAEIARRYFAMNAFDGVLTTVGVLNGQLPGWRSGSRHSRPHGNRHIYRYGRLRTLGGVSHRDRRAAARVE